MVGRLLSRSRVVSPLGAGGMGEVYSARDTRLDRTVAVKVLPPEFSADPDRRARSEREAKTIAGAPRHLPPAARVGSRGHADV